jgi:hypothetical protein
MVGTAARRRALDGIGVHDRRPPPQAVARPQSGWAPSHPTKAAREATRS